jgi:hypothetical protein
MFVLAYLGPRSRSFKHPEPETYFLPSKTSNLHHKASVKQVQIKLQWAITMHKINLYSHGPLLNFNISMNR